MKFKILPKVRSFSDALGVEHLPGDVVDLPSSYLGESWLDPVDKPENAVPVTKVELIKPAAGEEQQPVPFEPKTRRRRIPKKTSEC